MLSRRDKVVGAVVGAALFAGLFYLIYDSFVAAPAREEIAADNADELGVETPDENVGEAPATDEETPVAAQDAAAPAAPAQTPAAPAPGGKGK